jgi:hypothetical protein
MFSSPFSTASVRTDAVEKVDFANGVSLWSFDLLSGLKQLKKGDFDAEPD